MSIGAHDVSRRWRFVGQAKPVNVQPYVALKTGGVTVNFACERSAGIRQFACAIPEG
jgi:hypothetical protein